MVLYLICCRLPKLFYKSSTAKVAIIDLLFERISYNLICELRSISLMPLVFPSTKSMMIGLAFDRTVYASKFEFIISAKRTVSDNSEQIESRILS